MGELIISILIFVVVIILAAVLFAGWVILSIMRWIMEGLGSLLRRGSGVESSGAGTVRCRRELCRTENPVAARFCRRCGRALPEAERVAVRRAAVW